MIFPPVLIRIRSELEGKKRRRYWLPVFLLWPFIPLLFAILLLLFLLRGVFGRGFRKAWRRLRIWGQGFVVYCRLRRIRVEAVDEENDFYLSVW